MMLCWAFLLAARHYRLIELSPGELSLKQPKPPQLPEDCREVRRAVELSSQSITSGHEKAVRLTSPLDADELAIYRIVVQRWNSDGKPLTISAETFPLETTFSSESTECACWSGFSPESLLGASHSFHVLTANDLPIKGIRVVSRKEHNAIASENDPDATMRKGRSVKDAVDNAVAHGLFSMSEIVFDSDRRRALVSYGFYCGSLCGNGRTLIFEKVDGNWRETDRDCGGRVS